MTLGISKVLDSRMMFCTAGVQSRISTAGIMPRRSIRRKSVCDTTASSVFPSMDRIWFCWPAGYMSMMRSTVCPASTVCRVDSTRRPVSAADKREGGRLEIAHLAHEDDVRVLPERVLESGCERGHVLTELTLLDEA